MILENIRISQQAKDQLIRLKRTTGITNWNVLCRWAYVVSLAESSPPLVQDIHLDSTVEMTWKVFGGKYAVFYEKALIQRCVNDGIELTVDNLQLHFKLHLHRGIAYLASSNKIKSATDLIDIALHDL